MILAEKSLTIVVQGHVYIDHFITNPKIYIYDLVSNYLATIYLNSS